MFFVQNTLKLNTLGEDCVHFFKNFLNCLVLPKKCLYSFAKSDMCVSIFDTGSQEVFTRHWRQVQEKIDPFVIIP